MNKTEICSLKEPYIICYRLQPRCRQMPDCRRDKQISDNQSQKKKKDFGKTTESGENSTITSDFCQEIKINKKDLNCDFKYRASTDYGQALSFLLLHERHRILDKLKTSDDKALFIAFIEECKKDFVSALKFAAKKPGMNYLFSLEDDTL